MDRRLHRRISTDIKVRFYCNNTDYAGTITDISEGGMFIKTKKVSFPFESNINICIDNNSKLLKVPVTVCRLTKTGKVFDGMGVQVAGNQPEYLKFVRNISSCQP